jgi:hypothetical protein
MCILYVGLVRKCLSQKFVNADDNSRKILIADEIREISFSVKMPESLIMKNPLARKFRQKCS